MSPAPKTAPAPAVGTCEVPGCDRPASGELCEQHGRLSDRHAAAVRFVQTTREVKRLRNRLATAEHGIRAQRARLADAESRLQAVADELRGTV